MPTYDSTTGLRALLGSNLVSDIDTGFLTLAQDVAAALGHAMQEGVKDAGSFEVTQASGGAGMVLDIASNVGTGAFVQNDSATGLPLVYLPPTGSKSTVTVTTAHATLPRVDSVYVTTGGVVTFIAGTATSGATLDNARDGSHGGPTIPSNALHLADLLVPATDTTISNNQIRDRRRWARGAYNRIVRNANGAGDGTTGAAYTTASATLALIDGTNLAPRIECSGAPLRVSLVGLFDGSAATNHYWAPQVDSVGADGMPNVGANPSSSGGALQIGIPISGTGRPVPFLQWTIVPTAGSHVIAPAWASGSGTATLYANATRPCAWIVEEIVRQNTANNATTTG